MDIISHNHRCIVCSLKSCMRLITLLQCKKKTKLNNTIGRSAVQISSKSRRKVQNKINDINPFSTIKKRNKCREVKELERNVLECRCQKKGDQYENVMESMIVESTVISSVLVMVVACGLHLTPISKWTDSKKNNYKNKAKSALGIPKYEHCVRESIKNVAITA